jgi:hypothetical protein
MRGGRAFTWLIASVAVIALMAATAAPLLAAQRRVEAVPLYLALEFVCHQLPERSWSIGELQAGLCVRCFGLYGGLLLAAVGGLRFSRKLLAAGVLMIGLSWAVEAGGWNRPPDWVRFSSGALFGAAAGAVFRPRRRL